MNERIKELAKQADTDIFKEFDQEDLDFCEKFAGLIIQECIDLINKEQRNMSHLLTNPPQNGGIFDAMNSIRFHFGMFP